MLWSDLKEVGKHHWRRRLSFFELSFTFNRYKQDHSQLSL